MRSGTHSLHFLKLMALGAVSFWLPDILWHAATGARDVPGLVALTIPSLSMPLALLCMYLFLQKRPVNQSLPFGVGFPLMLGIWTLAGFFMAVGASFEGGGFAGADGVLGGIEGSLLGLIPVYTFIMATYDGALGALFVATLGAVVIAATRRWKWRRQQPEAKS
jgi:hypothetical protein